ncbi:hypothetical protein BDB01DRAFT_857356 [Pilobolus umbonatus]|nr:hypothetical protein BDB01DRAFT_857356 [Pilobolus umbonatus]
MFTNKLNTSRDIGVNFAKQSILQHVLQGGYWKDMSTGKLTSAGAAVKNFIEEHEASFTLDFFGGTRDFQENNELSDKPLHQDSLAILSSPLNDGAVFVSPLFVGVVGDLYVTPPALQHRFLENGERDFSFGYIQASVPSNYILHSINSLKVESLLDGVKLEEDK